MSGMMFRISWLACAVLLAGGCGEIPDIIVEGARASAKEALQEAVGDVIDDIIEDTVDELLDYADFESQFLHEGGDETEGDVFEEAGEDEEESDQDTGHTGRGMWDHRR